MINANNQHLKSSNEDHTTHSCPSILLTENDLQTLKEKLDIGDYAQNLLLRSNHPEKIEGFQLETLSIPSKEIDGNFYDIYQPSRNLVDIVLADVMGKGLPAALVGTTLKNQLIRFALPLDHRQIYDHTNGWYRDILGPAHIIQRVHQELTTSLENLEHFVNLFYGRFDMKKRTFTYIDCGSTKPLHYCARSNSTHQLKGNNLPLGVASKDIFSKVETVFEEGDLFLFYSDGVVKARSSEGELYGVERLSSLLQKNTTHSASDLVNIIHSDVTLFAGNKPFLDGFSLILFKVEADIVAHANTKEHICKFDSDLSQLKFVRSFINSFCVQLTENHKPLSEPLSLATNEVFCNIIKHGYKNQPGNQVIIQAEAKESEITIEILDQGVSFDPTEIQHPSFSGDKDGGFGFFLIKSIADQLSYSKKKSEEGWNCLRITKKYNFYEDEMEFSNYNDEDILVVKLEKESLDAKEAPEFKKRITSLIDQEGAQKVIFDLSKLTFIDSTGLGCFLSILRSLNGSQGDLKLANMTRSIHAIFEIVCMNKIFEIYNSVEEALEAYQSGKVST